MPHSNVRLLSDNDMFLDGWNESYIVQYAMWNHSQTWLFRVTTGCKRLDYKMVAMMIAA
jgi:hypothetical protein